MDGMTMMLKSMGIDPDEIKKQFEGTASQVMAKVDRIEATQARIEAKLDRMFDMHGNMDGISMQDQAIQEQHENNPNSAMDAPQGRIDA